MFGHGLELAVGSIQYRLVCAANLSRGLGWQLGIGDWKFEISAFQISAFQ
jgi:hypothetical protein